MRLPLVRQMRCVQLRRLHPLGEGQPRGRAIVRHYWAQFLEKHRSDLRGRGLEIGGTWTIRGAFDGESIYAPSSASVAVAVGDPPPSLT